jgi:hypothetical protein
MEASAYLASTSTPRSSSPDSKRYAASLRPVPGRPAHTSASRLYAVRAPSGSIDRTSGSRQPIADKQNSFSAVVTSSADTSSSSDFITPVVSV